VKQNSCSPGAQVPTSQPIPARRRIAVAIRSATAVEVSPEGRPAGVRPRHAEPAGGRIGHDPFERVLRQVVDVVAGDRSVSEGPFAFLGQQDRQAALVGSDVDPDGFDRLLVVVGVDERQVRMGRDPHQRGGGRGGEGHRQHPDQGGEQHAEDDLRRLVHLATPSSGSPEPWMEAEGASVSGRQPHHLLRRQGRGRGVKRT
jgi:hypothetical protein